MKHNHPKIEIMDTTLRDGEQTSGVSFVPHEKLMIARLLLEELKVDRVEVASARVSEGEFDDYMEEFIGKANLEKELQQMNEAKENLLLHTGFSKLSEDERMLLFMQYAESREFTGKTLIKTRTEDNVNSCETNKQIAYAQAKADYDNAIIKCRQESSTNYCYTQALAKYERSKRTSDRVYEECIKK